MRIADKILTNKFEMFQTIISFMNLMPSVFKLAYVHTVYKAKVKI